MTIRWSGLKLLAFLTSVRYRRFHVPAAKSKHQPSLGMDNQSCKLVRKTDLHPAWFRVKYIYPFFAAVFCPRF